MQCPLHLLGEAARRCLMTAFSEGLGDVLASFPQLGVTLLAHRRKKYKNQEAKVKEKGGKGGS